jgi:uncharacterized protein
MLSSALVPHFPHPPPGGIGSACCRVLALDGGGTKGYQTLGVLKEIETALGVPLCQHFDLIYGTSTGACTAAFLALGSQVDQIVSFYRQHIPTVLRERTPHAKSEALQSFCQTAFGARGFSMFRTGVGIMCTDWRRERPVEFKTGSVPPGMGCSIAQAIRASCSAYPLFEPCQTKLGKLGTVELVDGSYCANNPVVFAIAEAITGLKRPRSELRVVSIGVGTYPAPTYHGFQRLIHLLRGVGVLQKTLSINTESMEQLRQSSFPDVTTVRINDHFGQHGLAVDFIESDEQKLDMLFRCGRRSFARHERALRSVLA